MRALWIGVIIIGLVVAACQPQTSEAELPTLAVLPSLTPTTTEQKPATDAAPTLVPPSPMATITAQPDAEITAQPSATPAPVEEATITPTIVTTPTETLIPLAAGEIRRITLTPRPDGQQPSGSEVMADLAITEGEFYRALQPALENLDTIQNAEIDFNPSGMTVIITAIGGQAYVSGQVSIDIQVSGTFATFSIREMLVNGAEPSETFVTVVTQQFFPLIVTTLDDILTARLGEGHDLENIVLTDTEMRIFLLVPEA